MGSASKTTNLGLNQWAATDRPLRADFVDDNRKIDEAVGTHINNQSIHMTAAEKSKAVTPYEVRMYAGTGADTVSFSFSFSVKFVFIYKKGAPFNLYQNSENTLNSAAGSAFGCSGGLTVSGTSVTVTQQASAVNGVRCNLNESGAQYVIVAFK